MAAMILKTPSAFDATVTSPKKNPVSGDSGSLAQEIMGGYAERRGPLPTPRAMDSGGRGAVTDVRFENGTYFRENSKGVRFGVQLTDVMASGLLPTVQTQGLKICKDRKTVFMPLDLLPTPNASEATKYTTKYNPNSQMGTGLTALAVNGMLPTPAAQNHRGASSIEALEARGRLKPKADNLADQFAISGATSRLNPLFVVEMMGFPGEYLVLPFLTG
jgi:hypothetical protein